MSQPESTGSPSMLEICLKVQEMNVLQLEKFQNNLHKPGWAHRTPLELIEDLRTEVLELELAIRKGNLVDVGYECADVNNIATMIADVCGQLIPE